MSQFRGSRRLMARISQHRHAKRANREALLQKFSPAEEKLRRLLAAEAAKGFAPVQPELRKSNPED